MVRNSRNSMLSALLDYIYICNQHHCIDKMQHEESFLEEFNRFEFRVCILIDRLLKSPISPTNNSKSGGIIVGYIYFPRVLGRRELQSV